MRHRAILITAATAVLAVSISACGSSGGNNAKSGSKSGNSGGNNAQSPTSVRGTRAQDALAAYLEAATKLTVTAPLSSAPPTGKSVYFLSDGSPIASQIAAGIQAASKRLAWHAKVLTYDVANPASANSAMLSAVNEGADAVVFPALDAVAISEGLKAAARRKVVVIGDATGNPPGTPGITAEVNSARTAGQTWGKLVGLGISADAEKSGAPAKVVEMTAPAYASILKPIDDSVKETLGAYCEGCRYDQLDIAAQDLFAGKGPQLLVSYLQSHPDTTAVSIPAAGIMQPGVTAALASAGLNKVKVYGAAPLDAQIKELQADGPVSGYAVDPLAVTGWMCVDTIVRQFVDGSASVYNNANTPQWWITKKTKLVGATAPQIPTDYQQAFTKMWGLS